MPAPGLRSNASEYDNLFIDGLPVPGIWHCAAIGAGYRLKQPKSSGEDGAERRDRSDFGEIRMELEEMAYSVDLKRGIRRSREWEYEVVQQSEPKRGAF